MIITPYEVCLVLTNALLSGYITVCFIERYYIHPIIFVFWIANILAIIMKIIIIQYLRCNPSISNTNTSISNTNISISNPRSIAHINHEPVKITLPVGRI